MTESATENNRPG